MEVRIRGLDHHLALSMCTQLHTCFNLSLDGRELKTPHLAFALLRNRNVQQQLTMGLK